MTIDIKAKARLIQSNSPWDHGLDDYLVRKPGDYKEMLSQRVPAARIPHGTPEFTQDEVFGPRVKQPHGCGDDFLPAFHAKTKGKPFILKMNDGTRFFIDPSGSAYIRYAARIA